MPKRSPYKRPGYRSCGKMVYGDAKKALKLARTVKSMLNVEYNLIDTQLTAVSQTIAPIITQLTNIAQGDTNITRDGNQIKVTHIQLKYFFQINASAQSTCCRIMLVHDKQTNGAVFTGAILLADVTAGDGVVSPLDENHRRRFRVLYDRVHDLSVDGQQIGRGRKFVKLNLPIRYVNNNGVIADISESSLALVSFATEATNTPTLTAFCRLLYVDN